MPTIPLNKLTPAKANVRKTGATEGIDELAASARKRTSRIGVLLSSSYSR